MRTCRTGRVTDDERPGRGGRALSALQVAESQHRHDGLAPCLSTQRYLNITDEELRKALTDVWERRRQLKPVGE